MPIHKVALGVLGVSVLAGCSFKAGGFESELDALRYENEQLRDQLVEMEQDRDEWRAKAEARATAFESLNNAEVLEALPRTVKIQVDPLTGFIDRDGEPGYEGIDVYILPKDARNRFVQGVGTMSITVTRLPTPGSDLAPVEIATTTLGPRDLREAYRNTLLSVHYSIPLPLDPPLAVEELREPPANTPRGSIQLVATFYDALTNQTHTATKILE